MKVEMWQKAPRLNRIKQDRLLKITCCVALINFQDYVERRMTVTSFDIGYTHFPPWVA